MQTVRLKLRDAITDAVKTDGMRPTARYIGVPMSLVRYITDRRDVPISNAEKIANGFNTPLLLSNHLYPNKKQNNSEIALPETVPAYAYDPNIDDAEHMLGLN